MRLGLGALTPVRDGTGDKEFPLGQRADLSSSGVTDGFPSCLAGRAFRLPVAAYAFGSPLAALLVAEPIRPGQIVDPGRDRTFRDTQFGGDLVVVIALLA